MGILGQRNSVRNSHCSTPANITEKSLTFPHFPPANAKQRISTCTLAGLEWGASPHLHSSWVPLHPLHRGGVRGGLVESQDVHRCSAVTSVSRSRVRRRDVPSPSHPPSQADNGRDMVGRLNSHPHSAGTRVCQWRMSQEPGFLSPLDSNKVEFPLPC